MPLTKAGEPRRDQDVTRHDRQDVEKGGPITTPSPAAPNDLDRDLDLEGNRQQPQAQTSSILRHLQSLEQRLVRRYRLEARGIERVSPSQRHTLSHLGLSQICLLWIGINLAATNLTLGMLGPVVYGLRFLDSSLCAVFGMLLGCLPVAYIATFGPRSGNRTMVLTRYVFGWYPTKVIVVLTLIILLGYCIIDVVIAGQILSAVSRHDDLSVIVGIVITAVITWAITTFGYSVFHVYERYIWLLALMVFMLLAGVAGPKFDLYGNPSAGLDERTVAGNRLSFFSLAFAAAIAYACAGADFFVYYPENTSRWRVFLVVMLGLSVSFTPMFVIGIGLGSGIASDQSWSDAYGISQGALVVEAFKPLGAFGSFCSVMVALGLISNLVASTYAGGIDWQALGRYFEKVPRVAWNTLSVIIYAVCAVAGRASLAAIFTNFLALMGYWSSIWIAIFLEEHLIFRKWKGLGWNWEAWSDCEKLPLGIAAFVAFLVGWAGAILCMAQVWFIGPLSALIGQDGGDMGSYIGFSLAALIYPFLRVLELRRFGR